MVTEPTTMTNDELEQYRSTIGAEIKTADVASDEHALKQALGQDDPSKERIYDAKIAGERFVQFYDDPAAAIREYLSNAETACIRRARAELIDAGVSEDDIPADTHKMLALAQERADYEPLIEVTHSRSDTAPALVIEDNGIGISVEEYQVVQRIGYSTSHMHGERLGQFGMGWMSGFLLTGVNGAFRMYTRSYLTDEAYSTVEYVANFEYLDGVRSLAGTRFEFPSFSEEAKDSVPVAEKVAEYSEGMRIPVLYRDFDETGAETHRSDDFLPRNIEDDYDDDLITITYENEFFKAVMAPRVPEGRRRHVTYNVTMPIKRNTDEFGRTPAFHAPWQWDFRAKREDGPIVACESDPSVIGRVPVDDTTYERMSEHRQKKSIRRSAVPDDAIEMVAPASSRDSYMAGNDAFWKHVSTKLLDAFNDRVYRVISGINRWSDFTALTTKQKALVVSGVKIHVGYSDRKYPDKMQQALQEELGVTVSDEVATNFTLMHRDVLVVPRDSNRKDLLKPARENAKNLWEVIDEAPDGVYVAKTISQTKAQIAHALGDTHIIRIDPQESNDALSSYESFQQQWGFKLLKDLPSRNLREKLPQLDDDLLDELESSSSRTSTSSRGSTSASQDAGSRTIKVRYDSSKTITSYTVNQLIETTEKGESVSMNRFYNDAEYIMVYDQNEIDGSTPPTQLISETFGVAATAVPKYVHEYIEQFDGLYTDEDALIQDFIDDHADPYTSCDVLVVADEDNTEDIYRGRTELLRRHLSGIIGVPLTGTISTVARRTYRALPVYLRNHINDVTRVIVVDGNRRWSDDTEHVDIDIFWVYMNNEFPDLDTDSDHFEALFGYGWAAPENTSMRELIEVMEAMGDDIPDGMRQDKL